MILFYRIGSTGISFPIRVFLTNESGYYLDISLYKEVTDLRTGQVGMFDCTPVTLVTVTMFACAPVTLVTVTLFDCTPVTLVTVTMFDCTPVTLVTVTMKLDYSPILSMHGD